MIERFLFKKLELWVVLLLIKIIFLTSLLFGSLLLVHSNDPKRFPVLGNLSTEIANFPISVYKALFVSGSNPAGLVSTELRFDAKDGEFFNENYDADQIVVIPHVCPDQQGWCVSLFDLMTHDKFTITDINQIIRSLTNELKPEASNNTIGASNVLFAPRFDELGNLYLLTNSGLFVKLGSDMQVKWAKSNLRYHHTFNFTNDRSSIWAIGYGQENCKTYPEFAYDTLLNDCLVQIDSNSGNVISIHSMTNAMIDANLHNHLFIGRLDRSVADPLHINDVQPVNLESSHFSKGDVFVSLGHANMVLLYNTISREIKWNMTDGLFHQHDVDILDGSTIAIFNNNRVITDEDKVFKHNEILKYDFNDGKKTNLFQDIMKNYDVRTVNQGLFEIIGESFFVEDNNYGRVLLFNKEAPIFEYYSKNKEGFSQNLGWSYVETNPEILKELRKYF